MNRKKGILEELVELTGCLYLSDLHNLSENDKIKKAIESIKTEKYGVREWQEAFFYITGTRTDKGTEKEIRELF